MRFSSLVGNEQAKALLLSLAQQVRSSYVLLFSGPEGVGKSSFAEAFSTLLLGDKQEKKIKEKIHPDVLYFQPEGKMRQHPISSIRQMIESASIPPFEGAYKIHVIAEAEKMLPSSSNALLKTLEEPLDRSVFILMTSKASEMLPTILSRCLIVPFEPIQEQELAFFLQRTKGVSLEEAKKAAMAGGGCFSKALSFLQSSKDPLRVQFQELLSRFFLDPPSMALIEALAGVEKTLEKREGKEENSSLALEGLFEELLFWVRDLHCLQSKSSFPLFHASYEESLARQLQKGSIPSIEKTLESLERAQTALQRSMKPRVLLEHLLGELSCC